MRKVLVFAAVAEALTGLALLLAPSLVAQLLLGLLGSQYKSLASLELH
jgi:hypothetical protein